ncbi:hypothetical protein WN944_000283 [Citrus x changshan-huyou]|uniref:Uncharacterized protein n=1 Tax=Citrus x changshan-huyou TaxID=2935761 RepID=A0AAP0MF22_9ROSI
MVYELVLHLKFSILAPKSMVPVIHFEGAFPHSPCAVEFIHRLFPLGILNPDAGVPSHSADQVFVFLALAEAVIPEFGGVSEFLFGRTEFSHLAVASLADEMLGGALDWGRGFVFDLCLTREFHLRVLASRVAQRPIRISLGPHGRILLFFSFFVRVPL